MKIGYARVSTYEQNLDLQIDDLKKNGCEKIYEEKVSGSKADRPILQDMLKNLRNGDVLVVWKLDRLGRSLKDLLGIVSGLQNRGVELVSLKESIDTTSSTGKLIFSIFGALAEYEKDIIRERTMAGLNSARARGIVGGRKKRLSDKDVAMLRNLANDKTISISVICNRFGISRKTYYNYLKKL
ncbi:MAG TPA: recombinase family protein [Candidatus Cloacimonadota bacterium]|nr:recombinase family protein [Candidatus Cloacimonadota bacterium]